MKASAAMRRCELGGPLQTPTNHVRAARSGSFGVTPEMCLLPKLVLLRGDYVKFDGIVLNLV